MRISKKILAIALSILMAVSMMPFTAFASGLPTATVTDITNTAENTPGLDIAYKFEANNDGMDYAAYQADFVVTVDKDVSLDDLQLWGRIGDGEWINMSDALGGSFTAQANTPYYLLRDAFQWMNTYGEICNSALSTFSCGIKGSANSADVNVTVDLVIYDDTAADPTPTPIGDEMDYTVPALPTATVTEITNTAENTEGLDVAYKFEADAPTTDYYDDYMADYIVVFDKNISSDDIELWGQYGSYPWTALSSEASGQSVTYTAGEPYYLLRDVVKWPMKYSEIAAIGTFKCGLKAKASAAGTAVNVQLAVYDGTEADPKPATVSDASGNELADFDYTVPALPTATVIDITNDTTENTQNLDQAFKFIANNDGTAYDAYQADFIVTFDQDVSSDDLEMWGRIGNGEWVNISSQLNNNTGGSITYEAGTPYYLLRDVVQWTQTYAEIAANVGTFSCGVKAKPGSDGANVNIQLAIYDDTEATPQPATVDAVDELGTVIGPAQIVFTAPDFVMPTVTVTDITNTPENSENLDAAYKFETANDGLGYDDYQVDFIVTFDKEVTSDQLQLWGQYGSYPWTNISSEASGNAVTYEAGKPYYLLRDIVKWPMNYSDIAQMGTFLCGIKNISGNGATVTVDLAIYDDTEATPAPTTLKDPAGNDAAVAYTVPAIADGGSIVIDDKISLNVYVDVDGIVGADTSDVTVEFTRIKDASKQDDAQETKTYSYADIQAMKAGAEAGDYAGTYKFSFDAAPAQIADNVTVTVKKGGVAVHTSPITSIKDYCESIENDADTKLANLAKAVLDYGKAASAEFGYNTAAFTNQAWRNDAPVAGVKDPVLEKSNNVGAIKFKGIAYIATSVPALRLFIDADETDLVASGEKAEVTVGSRSYQVAPTVVEGTTMVCIDITNILAEDLDAVYTVSIGGSSLTLNALAYTLDTVSHSAAFNTALLNYNAAAEAYFA